MYDCCIVVHHSVSEDFYSSVIILTWHIMSQEGTHVVQMTLQVTFPLVSVNNSNGKKKGKA